MKSKRIMTLVLAGVLSVGGIKAYAQISKGSIPKNTVISENAADKSNIAEEKFRGLAVKAFKNYFNEDVNPKDLTVKEANLKNQKAYIVINDDKTNYHLALIDSANDKILHLQSSHGEPTNDNYKNYPLEDAKKLAADFVKENNILGKNYTLSKDAGKELNADKELSAYFFYFEYADNKQCLVTVDKDTKKVDQFILFDEQNGPADQDQVNKQDRKVNKSKASDKKVSKVAIDRDKLKKVAVDGFKKYFDGDVNPQDLDIQLNKWNDDTVYFIYPKDGRDCNCATLDSNYNILDIQPNIHMPKGDEYQKYTYNEAKKLVMDYMKEKNIVGKDYTLLENIDKEMNVQKEPTCFFFHFKHGNNERVLVTVDKATKKIDRIMFKY